MTWMIASLVLTAALITFIFLYARLLKEFDEFLCDALVDQKSHSETLAGCLDLLKQNEELLMKEQARLEVEANPVLAAVHDKLYRQTEKGLRKYPNTVNPNDYTLDEWLTHIQEEAIDMTVYAEVIKKKLEESK